MKKLLDMAEQLSERYLISEVMELPEQAEDQVYYCLLYTSNSRIVRLIERNFLVFLSAFHENRVIICPVESFVERC